MSSLKPHQFKNSVLSVSFDGKIRAGIVSRVVAGSEVLPEESPDSTGQGAG